MRAVLISITLIISLSGCNLAYRVLLGINTKPSWKLDEDIIRDFKRKKIAPEQRFILDTASYRNVLINEYRRLTDSGKIDSAERGLLRKILNDDLQPTQVRFFNNQGKQIFKMVNCYIDPPIPMNWNVNNCFATYPPQVNIQTLNVDQKPLHFFLPHLKTIEGKAVSESDLPDADYYVLVFWNTFFHRPSKRLIRRIKREVKRNSSVRTSVLYVHNHNAELWPLLDSAQRSTIANHLKKSE